MEKVHEEYTEQEIQFLRKAELVAEQSKEYKDWEDFILTTIAISLALAHCDGEFHPDEKKDIEEFVFGISEVVLPSRIKLEVKNLYNSPPTFDVAIELVKKVGREYWPTIESALRLVAESDGIVHKNEKAFLDAWDKAKTA